MPVVILVRYLANVADVVVRQGHLDLVLAIVRIVPQFLLLAGTRLVPPDFFSSLGEEVKFFLCAD